MTLKCDGCGDEFERHPALEVACPLCGARVGSSCKRPSEHRTDQYHSARRKLAFERNPCRCLANWEARQARGHAVAEPKQGELAL